MTVKTKKIPNFKPILGNEPPKNKIPNHLMQTKQLIAFYGIRGSGKTVTATTLLKKYKEEGLLQRLFVVTPTFQSNRHLFEGLLDDPDDLYEDATQESLDAIIEQVAEDGRIWKTWKEHTLIWQEYKRQERMYLAGRRKEIDNDLLVEAVECGLADMEDPPEYKFGRCKIPELWLLVDDCQSSPLFNQNTKHKNNLSRVMVTHRHIGNRIGINIIVCLQNYRNQTGCLARALRMNLTTLFLYGYRDTKLMEDIYQELGRELTEEEFYELFEYATSGEKWNCLVIEFGHKIRFRKGLDTFITVADIPEKNVTQENGRESTDSDTDEGAEEVDRSDRKG